jgi:hypothetical protein
MSKISDARNIASGTRLVEAADALLLQGLVDLLPSRGGIDREDREALGDLLVSLRTVVDLLADVMNPAAEMSAIDLAWLGLSENGNNLSDPVAKLIQLGVDPQRAQQAA